MHLEHPTSAQQHPPAPATPSKDTWRTHALEALESFGSSSVLLQAGSGTAHASTGLTGTTPKNPQKTPKGPRSITRSDRLNEAHLQTRHAQVAQEVQAYTRRLLASAGQDVLECVEGGVTGRSALEAIRCAVPGSKGQVRVHLPSNWLISERVRSQATENPDSTFTSNRA
jgi:hypothetical protein